LTKRVKIFAVGCRCHWCWTLRAPLSTNEQISSSLPNRGEETEDKRKSDCLIAKNLISCPELGEWPVRKCWLWCLLLA